MLQTFRSAIRGARERARHRHQYQAMLQLDDRMLRDMGIRRDEIRARMSGRNGAGS